MAWEPKPGKFSLFKNANKSADNSPDYKGDGLDLDGRPIYVSAWLKDGKNGKFMACSFKVKEDKPAAPQKPKQEARPNDDLDSDLPW